MGETEDHHPEWRWYTTAAGKNLVAKEIDSARMPKPVRIKLAEVMKRVARGEGHPGDLDNLGGGVREVRISGDRVIYRLLFSHERQVNVLLALHCFTKRTTKTPPHVIDLAKARRKDWLSRQNADGTDAAGGNQR
jgi:phage-related protein